MTSENLTVTGTQPGEGNTPESEAKKAPKKAPKPVKVTGILTDATGNPVNETETVPVINAKGEVIRYYPESLHKDFLKFVGTVINEVSGACIIYPLWPSKKCKAVIPAKGMTGERERALKANKNILAALTGNIERDEVVTGEKERAILQQYVAKGWKFRTFTKVGITTVAAAKVAEFTAKVAAYKAITAKCPELAATLKNTANWREFTKVLNEKSEAAAIKFAKGTMLALPEIR